MHVGHGDALNKKVERQTSSSATRSSSVLHLFQWCNHQSSKAGLKNFYFLLKCFEPKGFLPNGCVDSCKTFLGWPSFDTETEVSDGALQTDQKCLDSLEEDLNFTIL